MRVARRDRRTPLLGAHRGSRALAAAWGSSHPALVRGRTRSPTNHVLYVPASRPAGRAALGLAGRRAHIGFPVTSARTCSAASALQPATQPGAVDGSRDTSVRPDAQFGSTRAPLPSKNPRFASHQGQSVPRIVVCDEKAGAACRPRTLCIAPTGFTFPRAHRQRGPSGTLCGGRWTRWSTPRRKRRAAEATRAPRMRAAAVLVHLALHGVVCYWRLLPRTSGSLALDNGSRPRGLTPSGRVGACRVPRTRSGTTAPGAVVGHSCG